MKERLRRLIKLGIFTLCITTSGSIITVNLLNPHIVMAENEFDDIFGDDAYNG